MLPMLYHNVTTSLSLLIMEYIERIDELLRVYELSFLALFISLYSGLKGTIPHTLLDDNNMNAAASPPLLLPISRKLSLLRPITFIISRFLLHLTIIHIYELLLTYHFT